MIGAGTNDEPVEPCIPAFGILQVGKSQPRMDERFLHRVLRSWGVAKDQPRKRQEPRTGGRREDFERLVIATLCRLNEIALHCSLRLATG